MTQLLFYCYPFNFGWEMFYITALCHIFSWEKTYITLLPHVPRGLLTHKNDNVTLYSPIRHTVKYIHWLFIFQTDERWWLRWYTPSLPPHLYLPHIYQGQQGMLRSLVMETNLSLPGQQFKSSSNWRQVWIPFTLYWPTTWWLFSGFQSNSCSMGVCESKSHHPGWYTLFTETSEKLKSWKSFLGDNPQRGSSHVQSNWLYITIWLYRYWWLDWCFWKHWCTVAECWDLFGSGKAHLCVKQLFVNMKMLISQFSPTSENKLFPSTWKIISFCSSIICQQSEEACYAVTCTMDISRELQAVIKPMLCTNPNLVVVANSFSEGLHQSFLNSS